MKVVSFNVPLFLLLFQQSPAGCAQEFQVAHQPRIAVAFSGIVHRSLRYTIDSILRIFSDLRCVGFLVDCYYHTWKVAELQDVELSVQGDPLTWREGDNDVGEADLSVPSLLARLSCKKSEQELQETFDSTTNFDEYGTRHPWAGGLGKLRNAIRRLYSEKRVTELWQQVNWMNGIGSNGLSSKGSYYDVVMHLRPDLIYEPIDVTEILAIARSSKSDDRVYVGDFEHFCGVNDRFAVGKAGPMRVYGTRLNAARAFSNLTMGLFHPETFLKWHLSTAG